MIWVVKIPSKPELVKELQKLMCCKLLCQDRMELIIDHTNSYDLILNKTVQNVLRSLGAYPVNLEKTLLVCRPSGLVCFLKQPPERSRIISDVTCCMKYYNRTNIHTHAA